MKIRQIQHLRKLKTLKIKHNIEKVKLVSTELEVIEVDIEVASKSLLIKGMIENLNQKKKIALPKLKKVILEKIIEYCKYIKDNPPPEFEKPLRSDNLSDLIQPWYVEFLNIDQEMLFELILASNYLEIKSL